MSSTVPVPCTHCQYVTHLEGDAINWQCPNCRTAKNFRICKTCGDTLQITPGATGHFSCPYCHARTKIPIFGNLPFSTAAALYDTLQRRGALPKAPQALFSAPAASIGGYGHDLPAQAPLVLHVDDGALRLAHPNGEALTTLQSSDIRYYELGGPGMTQSGGGFVGGGFGVGGAIEGMLIAGVLNRLTSRTQITTLLHLTTPTAEYILLNTTHTPEQLKIALSPFLGRVRAATAQLPAGSPNLADQLKSIAQLHASGVLTDEEFAAAKTRLLTS